LFHSPTTTTSSLQPKRPGIGPPLSPITPCGESILDLRETIALFEPKRFATFNDRDPAGADLNEGAATSAASPRVGYVVVVSLKLGNRTDFALLFSAALGRNA